MACIRFEIELSGGLDSARAARRFLDDKLCELGFDGDPSVVHLLASELVSNAVRHGRPPVVLTVELVGGRASVTVSDGDAGHLPTRQHAAVETPTGGRGLHIVDELADDWGCDVREGDGKAVWFRAGPA